MLKTITFHRMDLSPSSDGKEWARRHSNKLFRKSWHLSLIPCDPLSEGK
jgi:hypothetical protein